MSKAQKSNLVIFLGIFVLFLTTLQGILPTMPVGNNTLTLISAIVMFLVIIFTSIKQYLSIEIDNASRLPTQIILVIAILGGLNQFFDVITLPKEANQWLRFGITLVTAFLNLASKVLWPTEDTKSIL